MLDSRAQKSLNPLAGAFDSPGVKRLKYKLNTWKYTYELHMKDGSVLKANSDILKDTVSGKHFLYYSVDQSTTRIFPEQTTKIIRFNPYNLGLLIEGLPISNIWRFPVLDGRISAYCFFFKNKEITEIRFDNGEILPFNPDLLKVYIETDSKAIKAWEAKDYYLAIKIYNRKYKHG